MAATKSDLSEEDGWTPLRELVLLDCLEQFPPFGKDRHFHIRTGYRFSPEAVWKHLRKFYNVDLLNDEDVSDSVEEQEEHSPEEFVLPQDVLSTSDVMLNANTDIQGSNSPSEAEVNEPVGQDLEEDKQANEKDSKDNLATEAEESAQSRRARRLQNLIAQDKKYFVRETRKKRSLESAIPKTLAKNRGKQLQKKNQDKQRQFEEAYARVKSKRGEKYESFTQLLYGTLKELGEKASEAKIHKQMLANWHLLESTARSKFGKEPTNISTSVRTSLNTNAMFARAEKDWEIVDTGILGSLNLDKRTTRRSSTSN